MCNSVTSSESLLPRTISRDNNAGFHLCNDNFELDEETPSGSGTTHSTHGIVRGSGSRQVCTFDGNKHCPQIEKPVCYTYRG